MLHLTLAFSFYLTFTFDLMLLFKNEIALRNKRAHSMRVKLLDVIVVEIRNSINNFAVDGSHNRL